MPNRIREYFDENWDPGDLPPDAPDDLRDALAMFDAPDASRTDLLAYCKAVRTLQRYGAFTPNRAFAIIAHQVDYSVNKQLSPEEDRLVDQIVDMEDALELEEGQEGPPELKALRDRLEKLNDERMSEAFKAVGEPEMAELYVTDQEQFNRIMKSGFPQRADDID
jgi:hypothetical protein